MKRKRFLLLAATALVISVAGFLAVPHQVFTEAMQVKTHSAAIKKVDKKKWKVDKITAKKDDVVAWSSSTSDLYFQFMDDVLFGEYTYTVKKSQTLALKVKGASGTYKYAIFNMADSTYITGDSPPTIIIP